MSIIGLLSRSILTINICKTTNAVPVMDIPAFITILQILNDTSKWQNWIIADVNCDKVC